MRDYEARAAAREGSGADLRLRLRAGELSHERVWLAAGLGSELAIEALGEAPSRVSIRLSEDRRGEAERWLIPVREAGEEALIRAALAAALSVLVHFERVFRNHDNRDLARSCVRAAWACLRERSGTSARIADSMAFAASQFRAGLTHSAVLWIPHPPHTSALEAATQAARSVAPGEARASAHEALVAAAEAEWATGQAPSQSLERVCGQVGAELIEWALSREAEA